MTPTVGFIGLGAMGEPMAANLLAAGVDVVSCANRSRDAIERLADVRATMPMLATLLEAGVDDNEGPRS